MFYSYIWVSIVAFVIAGTFTGTSITRIINIFRYYMFIICKILLVSSINKNIENTNTIQFYIQTLKIIKATLTPLLTLAITIISTTLESTIAITKTTTEMPITTTTNKNPTMNATTQKQATSITTISTTEDPATITTTENPTMTSTTEESTTKTTTVLKLLQQQHQQ